MGLKLTEYAVEKAKEMKVKMQKPNDWVLCVGLRGGGCSGFMYDFDYNVENARTEAEKFYEEFGPKGKDILNIPGVNKNYYNLITD